MKSEDQTIKYHVYFSLHLINFGEH